MFVNAEQINQPKSGDFQEKIYDFNSSRKSEYWSWILFTDVDDNQTVGCFRGMFSDIGISKNTGEIIIITDDCVYRLNAFNLEIIEELTEHIIQEVEVSSEGVYIFHSFFEILKLKKNLYNLEEIESPFDMDDIKFKFWNNNILEFECEDTIDYSKKQMELDTTNWIIKTK